MRSRLCCFRCLYFALSMLMMDAFAVYCMAGVACSSARMAKAILMPAGFIIRFSGSLARNDGLVDVYLDRGHCIRNQSRTWRVGRVSCARSARSQDSEDWAARGTVDLIVLRFQFASRCFTLTCLHPRHPNSGSTNSAPATCAPLRAPSRQSRTARRDGPNC